MTAMTAPVRITVFGIALPLALVAAIIGATVLSIQLLAAARQEPPRAPERTDGLAVFTSVAEQRDLRLTVRSQGEARPRTQIDLVPQVAGRIVFVSPSFIEGGFFDADEPLIRIEDADYRLTVTQAEAAVARAMRLLESEQAQADLARRDWEELGRGAASPLTLREPQLAEARAELASARAQLSDARLQLERTVLSAPFAGRVRTKSADLGQYVAPGQSLGRVFSTDVVEVRLPLTDDELALLDVPVAYSADESVIPAPDVTLSARLGAVERRWSARLARTDSAIDPTTRSLFAIVEVDDPYGASSQAAGAPLPIGLFVQAEITGRALSNAIILPRGVLRRGDTVYVAEPDGRMSIRDVTVVSTNPETVILTDGVAAGEHAITSPIPTPVNGLRVAVYNGEGDLLFPKPDEEDSDADAVATLPEGGERS